MNFFRRIYRQLSSDCVLRILQTAVGGVQTSNDRFGIIGTCKILGLFEDTLPNFNFQIARPTVLFIESRDINYQDLAWIRELYLI